MSLTMKRMEMTMKKKKMEMSNGDENADNED